jgi:general secretion pathway protein I
VAAGEGRDGYSLVEAMVALFVLGVASAGLLMAVQAHIDGVRGLEDRAVAQWVAENRLAELSLKEPAADQPNVRMFNRDWTVEVARTPTADPELASVQIVVRGSGGRPAARLTGFVDAGAAA